MNLCLAIRWMDTCIIAKLTYGHVHTYVCMFHKVMDVYAYVACVHGCFSISLMGLLGNNLLGHDTISWIQIPTSNIDTTVILTNRRPIGCACLRHVNYGIIGHVCVGHPSHNYVVSIRYSKVLVSIAKHCFT